MNIPNTTGDGATSQPMAQSEEVGMRQSVAAWNALEFPNTPLSKILQEADQIADKQKRLLLT